MNLNELLVNAKYILEKPLRFVYFSIPDYIRYGKKFRDLTNFLDESQWWTKEQQDRYQFLELKKIINHAYKTVPYYTKLFNEHGIKPDDIQSFSDIKKIPYLTKDIIKNNFEDLISSDYKHRKLRIVTTGGSTGEPLTFLVDEKEDKYKEWAYVTHIWKRVGYDIKSSNRRVILMGMKPRTGIYEYKNRDLILSSYDITYENVLEYIRKIEEFNPNFIHCYPSSIQLLSNYILERNIKLNLPNLKAILCVSENLRPELRETISKAFNKRVFSFYGHSEHAVIAGECERSHYYHLEPFYGYTELLDKDGNEVNGEGEIGEIVATSFLNYAMPFIRYRTKDLAVNTNSICECGRSHKLIKKIEGREQEYFVTLEGNKVVLTGIYKILSEIQNEIFAGQFYQDRPGEVVLKVIPKNNIDEFKLSKIYNLFREQYNNKINLSIVKVEKLDRTNTGKFKFLEQKIKF
ncbi:AMP-binding protein [Aeribacillus sp. FSL K6-1305]|uniref:phenylacetate--CoA ligase family protein n=1 Tax=Aeribacillus sp. FSL K6-1305 TaxID=2954569 RepID=UPI0030FD4F21